MTRITRVITFYLALFLSASSLAQTQKAAAQEGETIKPAVSDAETLAAAYKREFAFLAEQKRELSNRLSEFRAGSQKAEQSLRQRIAAMERENLAMSNREDNLRTQLTTAEHKEENLHERNEVLEMTFSQANSTLKNYGRSLEKDNAFAEADNENKLAMVFAETYGVLKELSAVRKKSEKFYLLDGTEVDGDIVYIGNIAAYGVSENGSGVLVPAGNNRFRLWAEPAADVAKGMRDGNYPSLLKMFLFESKERAIDITTDKTVIEIIESGGLIGWVIVGLGILALFLAVARIAILYTNATNASKISTTVFSLLALDRKDQALAYCTEQKGPFARLFAVTLTHAQTERDHMEDLISETMLHESGPLNRFGSTILVIASVSPLLGLLGTVTGMISTFDIITEFGTGDPKMLSGGISIALVTTELGLIVAIPAVLVGTMLNSWADSIQQDLEEAALRASNILLGNVPQQPLQSPKQNEQFKASKRDDEELAVDELNYATS